MIASSGIIALLCTSPLAAGDPNQDPGASGGTGLFRVPRASTFGPGEVSFSVFYETLCREEGSSNVERGGITAGFGLGERFELFASLEPRAGVRRDFLVEDALGLPHSFAPPLNDHPFARAHWQKGMGDLRLGAKWKFAGDAMSYGGLALAAGIKFATANDEEGIGTGKTDFGTDLIGSVELGRALGLNGSIGLEFKGDPDGIELANELRWGIGLQLPTRSTLSAIVETFGVSYVGQPEISSFEFDNWAVMQGGLRLSLDNGLAFSAGINRTMSIDDDPLDIEPEKIGSFLQISFTSRSRPVAPPPPPPPANGSPTLTCRAEEPSVRRGESVRLFAEGRDPDGDVVSIRWSASAGTVSPSTGGAVTWNSTGAPDGTTTIVATAGDGRGGSATCDVRVRIEAPPAVRTGPTTRTLECSEFAVRSARLDNRCKAVMDDVALALRSSSGATVRLTGSGDAGELSGGRSIGAERAEQARDYLVRTHGVEASRIAVSSVSGSGRGIAIEITTP